MGNAADGPALFELINDNDGMSVLHPVSSPSDAVVRASNLTKIYGKGDTAVTALKSVDVNLGRGEFTAIMGPSGSGKSTLMHCLAGLDSITEGEVWLDDIVVSDLSERKLTKLRRNKIGFIFQAFNLIPTLTAEENITLPADIAKRKVSKERFDRVVDAVGIRNRLSHRPAELSGGQQQRVACARALVSEPAVVFADEPTGNLDSKSGEQVLRFLREAVDDLGQTVVMVTHDPSAASWADRVLFLVDGEVVAELREPKRDLVLDALRELGDDLDDANSVSREESDKSNRTSSTSISEDEAETPADSEQASDLSSSPAAGHAATEEADQGESISSGDEAAPSEMKYDPKLVEAYGPRPGETLDEALRRMAPAGGLDPEATEMVHKAQRILRDLPGSVIPEDDLELTGQIPIVRKENLELWEQDSQEADAVKTARHASQHSPDVTRDSAPKAPEATRDTKETPAHGAGETPAHDATENVAPQADSHVDDFESDNGSEDNA